jgi:hypothetical protein
LDNFVDKHRRIENWFYSGKGLHLQYIDSQIAELVMYEMRVKHNCLALPVHDSFIVAAYMEDVLRAEMDMAAHKTLNMKIRIERKEQDQNICSSIDLYAFDSPEFSIYNTNVDQFRGS